MAGPVLMQQSRVKVAEVRAEGRLRPVTEAGVASLIASITETGVMKDAIHVRKKRDGQLYLLAGGHRLEAARRLGWDEIEAKVWAEVTDDWARLIEIDDNLAGAEMNALDSAVFLATRKAVYERLHPETKQGVAGGLARQGTASDIVSFAESTAEKFGCSKRSVERMVAAGSRLGPDEVGKLRAAPKPVSLKDLQTIAKIGSAPDRYAVVDALAEGRAKSAAAALKAVKQGPETPVKGPDDAKFLVLLSAWSRASAKARRQLVSAVFEQLSPLVADEAAARDRRAEGAAE